MINVRLIQIGVPSPVTGRIFSEKIVDKMISEFKTGGYVGAMEFDYPVNLENVSHIVRRIYKEDGWLMGEIDILNTQKGDHLKDVLNLVEFRVGGFGKLGHNVDIEEFELTHISAVLKSEL